MRRGKRRDGKFGPGVHSLHVDMTLRDRSAASHYRPPTRVGTSEPALALTDDRTLVLVMKTRTPAFFVAPPSWIFFVFADPVHAVLSRL